MKVISYSSLLRRVKNGTQPSKVKWDEFEFDWTGYNYMFDFNGLHYLSDYLSMKEMNDENIEIIKEIEKLKKANKK